MEERAAQRAECRRILAEKKKKQEEEKLVINQECKLRRGKGSVWVFIKKFNLACETVELYQLLEMAFSLLPKLCNDFRIIKGKNINTISIAGNVTTVDGN